jgi:hypothetical protein
VQPSVVLTPYLRKRAIKPPASEPKPASASMGSSEPVCGNAPPLVPWLAWADSLVCVLSVAEVPAEGAAAAAAPVWPSFGLVAAVELVVELSVVVLVAD